MTSATGARGSENNLSAIRDNDNENYSRSWGQDSLSGGGEGGQTVSSGVQSLVSEQQSLPPTNFSELDLFDSFVGCSPTFMDGFSEILDQAPTHESINSGLGPSSISGTTRHSVQHNVPSTTFDEESRLLFAMPSSAATNDSTSPTNRLPTATHELLLSPHCSCNSPCRPPLAWIATCCIGKLDDNTRSRVMELKALDIPPVEVIHSLLESFLLFVNIYTPCVSEWDTYHLLHGETSQGHHQQRPMSLALLNAILFAASGFTTITQVQKAGFSNISQMRAVLYSRAEILYNAGCERDKMNRFRICLLMSYNRAYPIADDKASAWLREAQKLITQAKLDRRVMDSCSSVDEKRWKVLYASYIFRTCTVASGSRSFVSEIDIPATAPQVNLEDLEDTNNTWFLDAATKRKTAELFLSFQALSTIVLPLCHLLKRRTAELQSTASEMGSFRRSIMGELEELESRLVAWRKEHEDLLSLQLSWPTAPRSSDICVLAMLSAAKLSYEYIVCLIHQLNLVCERPYVSTWAANLLETSREVLEGSAATTIAILEDLNHRDVIRFLPETIIPFVLIPLAIGTVSIKSSSCSVALVRTLWTCYKAFGIFGQRFEIVDYYLQLSEMCTALTHERLLHNKIPYKTNWNHSRSDLSSILSSQAVSVPLPPTDMYTPVLRALETCFVRKISDPSQLLQSPAVKA